MKILIITLLFSTTLIAQAHEPGFKTIADIFATGKFKEQKNYQWPFPLLSIGHAMQSYQDYTGSPYWHDGLDIRANVGQEIFAAAGGEVVNIENYRPGNNLYWEIAIKDSEGFVWKYHHVAKDSIPQNIKDAFKEGTKIEAGTHIGNVVRWLNVSYGETYHHLHLLVVGADGQYINPFLMLEPLMDNKAPVINKIGLAQDHEPLSGNSVKGAFALYVEASDLVLHEKFILPPHKISYRLDKGDEHLVWEFIHLPSRTNDEDYIEDFYMDGTCGDYSCRKILINLNFSQEKPRDTLSLPRGEHEIEVSVEDAVGNKASKDFHWTVL